MFLSKLRTAARRCGAACVGTGAAILLAIAAVGTAEPPRDKTDLLWIDQRVVDWELSDQERRPKRGPAQKLRKAMLLAESSSKPALSSTGSRSFSCDYRAISSIPAIRIKVSGSEARAADPRKILAATGHR